MPFPLMPMCHFQQCQCMPFLIYMYVIPNHAFVCHSYVCLCAGGCSQPTWKRVDGRQVGENSCLHKTTYNKHQISVGCRRFNVKRQSGSAVMVRKLVGVRLKVPSKGTHAKNWHAVQEVKKFPRSVRASLRCDKAIDPFERRRLCHGSFTHATLFRQRRHGWREVNGTHTHAYCRR